MSQTVSTPVSAHVPTSYKHVSTSVPIIFKTPFPNCSNILKKKLVVEQRFETVVEP